MWALPSNRGGANHLVRALAIKRGRYFGGRAPILEEVVKSRPSLEEGPRFFPKSDLRVKSWSIKKI